MATARRLFIGVTALVLVITAVTAPAAAARTAAPESGAGAAPAAAARRSFYLSPRGSDSNSGSSRSPWRTISRASRTLRAGDTLYVRKGTYSGQGGAWTGASGTSTRPITIRNYPGEHPVFDGNGRSSFIWFRGSTAYIRLIGLRITGYAPDDTGIVIFTDRAHHILFEWNVMIGNVGDDQTDHLVYFGANAVHDVVIRENVLSGMTGGCIHFFHAPNARRVTISDNLIRRCLWGVILTSRADSVTIRKNTFIDNGTAITIWKDATNIRVRDNVVSVGSASASPAVGLWVERVSSLAYEDYNLWYSSRGRPIVAGSFNQGTFYSVASWRARTKYSNRSREGSPRFVGPGDYRLQSTSPARRTASDRLNMGRY